MHLASVSSSDRVRRIMLLALLYMLPLLPAINPVTDPDIWWHLRTGEWIIEHRDVPSADPFTTYGASRSWVVYSWLFDITLWSLYRIFGLLGIVLYTVLFSLLIAGALHRLIHRFKLAFAGEIFLVACGISAMAPLLKPRPWLFTILFFIVEVDQLIAWRRSGGKTNLWLLPILFLIWANVHIQFCYGLLLVGLAILERLVFRFTPHLVEGDGSRPAPLGHLMWVLSACLAATLVNPYHLKLYPTLIGIIGQTGQYRDILEMQPIPFREPWSWLVLFMTIGAAFALGWKRDLSPFPLLMLLSGLFLSFRGRRDLWFVVTAALPIIADSFPPADPPQRFRMTMLRGSIVGAAVIVAAINIGWSRGVLGSRLESALAEQYPVAASAFIEEHGYKGPLFSNYDWGSYLLWRLRSLPVTIDSRGALHGDEQVRRSGETWAGVNKWDTDPDLQTARLIVGPAGMPLFSILRLDPRFKNVYEDKVAMIFVPTTEK